jgi:hypothetical protein
MNRHEWRTGAGTTYLAGEDTRGRRLGGVERRELRDGVLLPRRSPERHQRRRGAGRPPEGPVHRRRRCFSAPKEN